MKKTSAIYKITKDFRRSRFALLAVLTIFIAVSAARAQTSAFTYQGRLTDNSLPANGSYNMKFRLYDALSAGNQTGGEISQPVTATNGIFTAALDFGAAAFPAGANRWLEIQIGTTTLSPRQPLTGSPFSVRSLTANESDALSTICNPCVTDGQIVDLSGSKITGSVANADNANTADSATTASNAISLGGVAAGNYLQKSGGTITGNLLVGGVLSGDGSGLTNLPGSGFSWQSVAGTSVQALPNKGYLADNVAQVTITLPVAPNVSDVIRVSSPGTGGFKIAQNAGQSIVQTRNFNSETTAWTTTLNAANGTAVALSADGTKAVSLFQTPGSGCVPGSPTNPGPCPIIMPVPIVRTSTDTGANWSTRVTTTGIWTSAASSADGTKLIISMWDGKLYTSTDSGANWTERESSRQWRAVASSADGGKLVAIVNNGQIYTSTDSGATWTPRESNRVWHGIASSADGTNLAAVVWTGQIYTSTDSGVTWTPRETNRNWTTISSSSDGTKLIAATDTGSVFRSSDSGVAWEPVAIPVNNYRSIALSADGTKYIVAGTNSSIYTADFFGTPSAVPASTANWTGVAISADGSKKIAISSAQIRIPTYRSPLNTTVGTAGYLINSGELSGIELQYVGNGEWITLNSKGAITVF